MAPVGVQAIFHEDKEVGLSNVCSELGVPYILSTASTSSIEEVAKASGQGPRWFQLYWPKDNDVTISLLKRAKINGYSALVVTLDTWAMSWRPADLDRGYLPFAKGVGNQIGFSDPVFRAKFEKEQGASVESNVLLASQEWLRDVFPGVAHSWGDIAFLKQHWDGPIILKGIQHVEDAKLAVSYGCDGIVVSNHGGSYRSILLLFERTDMFIRPTARWSGWISRDAPEYCGRCWRPVDRSLRQWD
jgi:isopentenyl diphosphate isomerase/L-lactate dehydrogenase-like FMN-dependent dehydrogenase